MLFRIDHVNKAVLHPEVVNLCPQLQPLNEKEVLYIILAYDYCSPYRQFPEYERKRKAMWDAFNDNLIDLIESPRIMAAADAYMSLQWNQKIETARTYEKKIDKFLALMDDDDSPSSIKKITDAITGLRKQLTDLEKEIDQEYVNKGVIKGNMSLSFLEELQSNMTKFKATVAKR